MPSPLTETRTLTELASLVLAEGRPVDLDGAELLVGWENAVIKTAEGWIYRFPRMGQAAFERELMILERLAGTLPAPTPEVAWTGRLTPFAAYRTIEGATADSAALRSAPEDVRRATAGSLAAFLVAMHDRFDETERAELGITTQNPRAIVSEIEELLPSLPEPTRSSLRALLTAYQETELSAPEPRPVVLHGDFHFGNLVLDQPTGVVAGVWDFSCVEYGNPASDLRYLLGDRADLAGLIADCYADLTGRTLDLAGARLVGALEEVTDALAEHRPIDPVLHSHGF
ncbi:phosphotransferase [Microlunatus speluncae]|uniref:phosphotransferase n=1 Tax=Microlunatus speluncae TaxID=2594267 RepID=UPI0012665105|nr:phosphotransferase [Microlunatus speluncae]